MKKVVWIFLLPITLLLTSCGMPFATAEDEVVKNYVESQAEIIASSVDVDENLHKKLEEVIKGKEEEFKSNEVLNDVRDALNVQKSLYQSIQKQPSPYDREKVKKMYLNVVQSTIDSYHQYEQVLEKNDRLLLESALSKHKIKQKNIMNKSLVEVNQHLEKLKIDKREALLPIEKKGKDKK